MAPQNFHQRKYVKLIPKFPLNFQFTKNNILIVNFVQVTKTPREKSKQIKIILLNITFFYGKLCKKP